MLGIRIGVSADPDQDAAFHLKLDPDPGSHANADPDLHRLRRHKKLNFYMKNIHY